MVDAIERADEAGRVGVGGGQFLIYDSIKRACGIPVAGSQASSIKPAPNAKPANAKLANAKLAKK